MIFFNNKKNLFITLMLLISLFVGYSSFENRNSDHYQKDELVKVVKSNSVNNVNDVNLKHSSLKHSSLKHSSLKHSSLKSNNNIKSVSSASSTSALNTLMQNIEAGCLKCFKNNLSTTKINIDQRFPTQDTLLSMSVGSGSILFVEVLLNRGADPNIKFNNYKYTMLMDAAFQGHEKILKLLLLHGSEIDKQDKEGKTALIYATKEGHLNCVKILLNSNANKTIIDSQSHNASYYADKYHFISLLKMLRTVI